MNDKSESNSKNKEIFQNAYTELFDKIEDVSNTGTLWGYPTGFNDYDDLTKGLQKSELTVIAGRHSMGKTSFVLNIATNLVEQKIPVFYISYDLDKTNLVLRIISALSEVSGIEIKDGLRTSDKWEKIANTMNKIADWNEYFEIKNNCYLYYKDLFDAIRNFKERHEDGVIIVDYFQLVKLYKQEDTRIIELSSLAAAFKHLAMEIELPIILVSQVSKKCEERTDKRPILSDLAECDALAQHCDNLLFVYRDEYYNKNIEDEDYDFSSQKVHAKGVAEIILAKQKNGPIGNFKLLYQSQIFKFKNPIKTQDVL